jgi:hypothetical protein
MEFSDIEHPEQAYRRGFHQGVTQTTTALIEAGLIEKRVVAHFVRRIGWWRANTRKWRRHIVKDRPPKMVVPNKAATVGREI